MDRGVAAWRHPWRSGWTTLARLSRLQGSDKPLSY